MKYEVKMTKWLLKQAIKGNVVGVIDLRDNESKN
jgi:hypothetical protein